MIDYNKTEIKEMLTSEEVFDILEEFNGEPYYQGEGVIISRTICHNPAHSDASHKLYYYVSNCMFHCYSGGCENPSFDIFELVQKVARLQWNKEMDLNDAVRWVAYRIGYTGTETASEKLEDWEFLQRYDDLKDLSIENNKIILKEYNNDILRHFNYNCILVPWLKDGITQEAIERAHIGFYPGGDQITIPHYDINGRFIGLRGRTMCKVEAELYGKYRPLKIDGIQYNHPLGFNLYNLNNSKDNIKKIGKAIVYEGEKSALLASSYFGTQNDISVASCGSNLSAHQVQLLLDSGAKEIIVAYDRDFIEQNDEIAQAQIKRYKKMSERYSNECIISFIFDNNNLLKPKQSPIDAGKDIFLTLLKNRVII